MSPAGGRSGSPRPGWCRSPSGRSRRSATRWSRWTGRPRFAVQSELVANEQLPRGRRGSRAWPRRSTHPLGRGVSERRRDGRGAGAPDQAQRAAGGGGDGPPDRGPARVQIESRAFADGGLVTVATVLQPGQRLRMIKFVAYGWSSERSLPARPRPGVGGAERGPADRLGRPAAEQRAYLDDFWDRADVEVDGDPEVQQAVRFALFHVLQAGARAEHRPIPAKGLTGPGYDGHAFWDTETFVLPVLTLHRPRRGRQRAALAAQHAAAGHRAGRASSACRARPSRGGRSPARNARATGRPAPPRSTSTPTSPTPSIRYVDATGDEEFDRGPGWTCWSRPPGCGARSATTTPRAGSTSTASPARTSTAPSPTTTSTPT